MTQRARSENLAKFLERQGVFIGGADRTVVMMRKNYLSFEDVGHLFQSEGVKRLRDQLLSHMSHSGSASVSTPAPAAQDGLSALASPTGIALPFLPVLASGMVSGSLPKAPPMPLIPSQAPAISHAWPTPRMEAMVTDVPDAVIPPVPGNAGLGRDDTTLGGRDPRGQNPNPRRFAQNANAPESSATSENRGYADPGAFVPQLPYSVPLLPNRDAAPIPSPIPSGIADQPDGFAPIAEPKPKTKTKIEPQPQPPITPAPTPIPPPVPADALSPSVPALAPGVPKSTSEYPIPPGTRLGKYHVTEPIGRGSFGVVYYAFHSTLNIPVAIKVLRPEALSDGLSYNEIRAEAQLLAKLCHPNIVRVWDFEDNPELPYLVLEYVDGTNLLDLLELIGRLQMPYAIELMIQCAQALQAASAYGIIHRDVKPANILITKQRQAKLTDFGLAVRQSHHMPLAYEQMQPNELMAKGTAAYMSPEQAGDRDIDFRTDIYALGVTFYQIVTGQLPFMGKTRNEILIKQSIEQPIPPHHVVPGLSPELSEVILKMIAKNPKDRYSSYPDLISRFESLYATCQAQPAGTPGFIVPAPGKRSLWKSLLTGLKPDKPEKPD